RYFIASIANREPALVFGRSALQAERLAQECGDFAARNATFSVWEKTYDHFLRRFPKAAKKARQQLIREGVVDKNFIIIAEDDAGELVPLSLTRAQLL
ncbi:hypothetical protein M8368_30400, partial [Enterobacter kobei]|nr:hypothetical protein [Enterobacter kobei]